MVRQHTSNTIAIRQTEQSRKSIRTRLEFNLEPFVTSRSREGPYICYDPLRRHIIHPDWPNCLQITAWLVVLHMSNHAPTLEKYMRWERHSSRVRGIQAIIPCLNRRYPSLLSPRPSPSLTVACAFYLYLVLTVDAPIFRYIFERLRRRVLTILSGLRRPSLRWSPSRASACTCCRRSSRCSYLSRARFRGSWLRYCGPSYDLIPWRGAFLMVFPEAKASVAACTSMRCKIPNRILNFSHLKI